MVIFNYSNLETFLTTLHEVSTEYELRINPKKWAIFAIRNHRKIDGKMNLRDIPVTNEYCYLGVTIDHSSSIEPQLEKIQKRSNYLRAHMRYYIKDLSFEN